MENQINNEKLLKNDFWYAEWSFPILTALLASGIFTGTHMYYVHGTGVFNHIPILAMLKAGLEGGGYGAAAAFGASFLFARILEGSLVGILDVGGSMFTGIGIGVPALILATGFTVPLASFPVALITGAILGLIIGIIIIVIRKFTIGQGGSSFGANILMGAGNQAGRFFGPLVIISACAASIPVGIGSILGALVFYFMDKPIIGGAILGAMLLGFFFPIG